MFDVLSDPAIYEFENAPPVSREWLRERYARLESRHSPDGQERWLNWVIRIPSGELIGYVQATVMQTGRAAIAYELNSRFWGQGLARRAVEAMTSELARSYGVTRLEAFLKRDNHRSLRLLERLGFSHASAQLREERDTAPDELLMFCDLGHAPTEDAP